MVVAHFQLVLSLVSPFIIHSVLLELATLVILLLLLTIEQLLELLSETIHQIFLVYVCRLEKLVLLQVT